jgi:hypothetical protein
MVPQDIFTYTVNDGHGGTTAANLTVTVYGPGSAYLQASESFDGHNTSFTANHDVNQTVTLQNVAPSSLTPTNFSFA